MYKFLLAIFELVFVISLAVLVLAMRSRTVARWNPKGGQPVFRRVPIWVLFLFVVFAALMLGVVAQMGK